MSLPLSDGPATLQRRKAIRSRSNSYAQSHRRPVSLPQDFAPQPFAAYNSGTSSSSHDSAMRPSASSQPEQHLRASRLPDFHRLSISSISSASTTSTLDTPLPTTPPMRPTELATPVPAIKEQKQREPFHLPRNDPRPRPRPVINRAPSNESSPSASHLYPDADPYDAQVIRQTRKRMAQQLLDKRKLERESSWGSLGTILSSRSDETHISQWSADRETRYAEWEKRTAEALASQRKLELDIERQRSFGEWQRCIRSEKARSCLLNGSASLSRKRQ